MSKIFKEAITIQAQLVKFFFMVTKLTMILLFSGIFVANATISEAETVVAETNGALNQIAQQTKTVKGVVKDSKGEILPGVTVLIKGTTNGTVSDIDGNYELVRVPDNATLVFSFVGMLAQSIEVGTQSTINVTMAEESIGIEEVVAIGYGTQKKSQLTGSISSISEKSLRNNVISNVSEVLAGKAAGVMVSAPSGQPGAEAIIRIRGFGTVNDNNPLYVVDGQFMDNIKSLNPSDIEHIEILKDASSTAIYGSRGSNGVILISTKSGKKGKTSISLDAYVGINQNYQGIEMMNREQYYNFILEGYKDDATFQNSQKEKFTNQYNKGYDTDWWKEVSQIGLNQNYNLSIQKGTENSRTVFSIGTMFNEGTLITTKFNRSSIRLNQEYDINKRITVGANVGLTNMISKDSGAMPYFSQIITADPFTPVINPLVDPSSENYEYNKYAPTEWSYNPNPVQQLRLIETSNKDFNAFGVLFASIKLFEGLTFRTQYSFERNNNTYKYFVPIYSSTFSEDMLGNRESKYNTETKLTNNSSQTFNYITEQRLNYKKEFGRNNLDVMFAVTYEKNDSYGINAYKTTALGNEEIYRILDAQTENDQVSGSKITTSMLSYLFRINYAFDNKYLATLSFRADGSSRFAKNNRWGYFPAFSLGWRVTQEDFFKNLDIDNWLSDLKIRVGWGQNGNQRIDSNASLTLIGTSSSDQYYFGNGFSQGYVPTYSGNKDAKWEISEQTNVGLDASLFKNSLNVTADFYIKNTRDMLLQMPVPDFGSFSNEPFYNAGSIRNTGFEFTVDYRGQIGKKFKYNVGGNISTYKTDVKKLITEYLTGSVSRTYVGGPIGRFWGYKQIGIFQNQEEINNYVDRNGTLIQPNAQPGDFKFAKLGELGTLNDNDDRTFIGNPNPDLIFGLHFGFNVKNFDFATSIQGTIGNDIWNESKGLSTPGQDNSIAKAYTQAWRQEGDNAIFPRITTSGDNNNYRASSFFVEDGSYARVQNIQLGYTLPQSLINKTEMITSCRFYISGQNLFTFTKYSGLDPEIGASSPLNLGIDDIRYPIYRSFVIGCNLQF